MNTPKSVLAIWALLSSVALASEQFGFREVWGYLMKGEEQYVTGQEPITDLCYFSARVNDIGRLDETLNPPRLPSPQGLQRDRRYHLVISAPASKTLMYFCLNKDLATREGLTNDIVRLGGPFDGVQIDFEAMRPEERPAYVAFLANLKRRLGPNKVLSVALPARTHRSDDAFDYRAISAAVDKALIMAYDEHWRTGPPGPIASVAWCERVVRHAIETIRHDKLVMGLPLYGRLWQTDQVARALKYPDTLALWQKQGKPTVQRGSDPTPHFTLKQNVNLAVYWEDPQSLAAKLLLYQHNGVPSVGFWRIGQGPAALWPMLYITK